jgi:anti-sigma-K factor RskA
MMAHSEDDIALAAEYALGSLGAEERAHAESLMAADQEFATLVQAWAWRLGALNQMVGNVEPRPIVWDNIKAAIAQAAPLEQSGLPEAPPVLPVQPVTQATPAASDATATTAVASPAAPEVGGSVASRAADRPRVDNDNVIRVSIQARRWRGIAGAVTALAAVLVALLGLQIHAPDLLPDVLRPSMRTRVVEVKTPAPAPTPSAQYVALLQGQAGGPAFVLTVDGATKSFTVRRVGAAPAEQGKSYELWLISDRLPRPRSLGVIGGNEFTTRKVLAAYDSSVVESATYAVTIEQAGGSPDGAPHSAPVYSGKLIETVPATPAKPPLR